jgi:uncharacterized iron-regulated membrane protein
MNNAPLAHLLENVKSVAPEHAGHVGHDSPAGPTVWHDDPRRISLDTVMAIARERHVMDAYAIALPSGPSGVFSILSDRNRAFTRAYIHVDQYSGKILADVRFKNFGVMGKFYSFGIIAHEGQLFGLANQLLGVMACAGVILLSVTGVMMWWSRRPRASVVADEQPPAFDSLAVFRQSRVAVLIAVGLACFLPLMAATLAVLLVGDRVLGARWTGVESK